MKYNELINLIPSKDLKNAIISENYKLDDYTLFKVGYIYSNSVEDRIKLCKSFIEENKLFESVSRIYKHLIEGYSNFKRPDTAFVYEAIILEDKKYKTTYLSRTYEDAVEKLKAAYLCDFKDNGIELSRLEFSITKRYLCIVDDPRWDEDVVEFGWLNSSFEIDNLYFANTNYESLSYLDQSLIDSYDWTNTKFPIFFKDGDLVKYKDKYGVVLHNQEEYKESIAYVVSLDNPYIGESMHTPNDEGIYEVLEIHDHVPFCELEIIENDNAPNDIRVNYQKLIEFYKWYKKN